MPASNPTRHPGVPIAASLLSVLLLAPLARGQGASWPRQFESTSGTFIVYQPQPEQLTGNRVTARAAFSLQRSNAVAPTFGVLWFEARVQIDRDSSTVTESDLDVTRVRLPGAPVAEANRYEHLVEAEATGWDLSGSLPQLQAGLAASARERLSVENLDHSAPRILFSQRRALLVCYDGKPQLQRIDGSPLQRVVNTPYAVVFDSVSTAYYLNGANLWYQARDPLGPWSVVASPPAAVAAIVPPDTLALDQVSGLPPVVIAATEPTELIVTDGEPLLAPLVGNQLLYVTNTESDVLREAKTGTVYVMLSGRWYTARTLVDPWVYVPADSLPAIFQQIPVSSPKGNLLASVAGTEAADDAVADNQIPQTSSISRNDHDVSVEWDGQPQFEAIDRTELQYGLNTDAQVVAAAGRFYLCDQGVWYVTEDANGPWRVSDVRPPGLDALEPSCPIYNLRFVDIYGVTPDMVTAGYLPGYLGYYPCRGTVVYGSGYRYRAWRGQRHYYPRAFTWGFHARYNPWLSGWSFGFSYSSGFLRVGMHWQEHSRPGSPGQTPPWLGPGGFHSPLLAEDHSMLRVRPVRGRPGFSEPTPANLYTRSENARRVVPRSDPSLRPRVKGAGRPARGPDNVFAGSDGKVYKRATDGQWKVNQGKQWILTPMPAQPSPPVVPVGGSDDPSNGASARGDARRPSPQPLPVQPAPGQPAPLRPAPVQPAPVQPAPVQPAPVQPAPVQPAPVQTASVQPAPVQPAPVPIAPAAPLQEQPAESAPPLARPSRLPLPMPMASPPVQQRPVFSPGGLERDFRARERSSSPAPAVTPAPPVPVVTPPVASPTKPASPPAKKPAPTAREK